MEPSRTSMRPRLAAANACLLVLASGLAWALEPRDSTSYLAQKELVRPELYLSSSNEPLEQVRQSLPNRAAWERFQAARERAGQPPARSFIDPRSGAATNILGPFPLIPGRGVGNRVTPEELAARIGRPAGEVDGRAVADAVLAFVREHRELLGVDTAQLGAARAAQVTPELWHVSIPQTYRGVPVRHGRLAATINHGNLVLVGTESWGNVRGLAAAPRLPEEEALAAGLGHAGGRSATDEIVRPPALEIVPVAPPEHQRGEGFQGPIGAGYRHRLVWTLAFRRPPDHEVWEVLVDAHAGEVLAFQDINHYIESGTSKKQIVGGVYPLTSTEICPTTQTCGAMQSGWPMPWADTGLPAPNDFTNGAGVFDWTAGATLTTLTGRFVDISDSCGPILNGSTGGTIDLGGANGQHDCTGAGGSLGNTAASRSAFYEVNKLAEMARGWLPGNRWLERRITSNVNLSSTCNAFYSTSAGTINFYRSGGGCRNTGEIAGVFDHEWGHALDDNDSGGVLSSSSEAYADIAAIYRLQTSCVGHGFFWTSDRGCGMTADGTGFNADEAQVGADHCDLDCSGVRDADWDKHSDHTPDTALGFVCGSCGGGSGPCGRQVHCAAAPSRQAAWDFAARDLQAPPFNLDSQTAFLLANKIFYQGSGNIGLWHACTCGSSSSGCGAANAYMQWLAADDDNGALGDGTPHMTALHAAFDRHGIACAAPAPVNSGCAGAPAAAPALSVAAGNFRADLTWTAVPGATRYWVFRSEGHAGCSFGKALIAETAATSYSDGEVANGRSYAYNVVAAGSSSACFGPASTCATAIPGPVPDFSISCFPRVLAVTQGSSATSTCTVTSSGGFTAAVALSCADLPPDVSCSFLPASVTPPANGSAGSTLTVSASSTASLGDYTFQVQGTSGALTRSTALSLAVIPGVTASYDSELQASRCSGEASFCDSGPSLLRGRDTIEDGAEPNQPNTLHDSCADGTSGSFHGDESIDRLRVSTTDGSAFAAGKVVRIDATVWAWPGNPSADHLDLYYTADVNLPVWVHIATLTPVQGGQQTLSAIYTLPSGARQAVRARFRYLGSPSSCQTGPYDDHDDLVFDVGP